MIIIGRFGTGISQRRLSGCYKRGLSTSKALRPIVYLVLLKSTCLNEGDSMHKQILSTDYHAERGFIRDIQKLIKTTVIPFQYDIMSDAVSGVEKSHVIQNFINAHKALQGDDNHEGFYGMVFQDSDIAKWIEGASYSLVLFPDKALEDKIDQVIEIIGKAQDKDGYLNTYFTIKDSEKRFTNLLEAHELYCAGHFIEAAVTHFEVTGKHNLLDIMLKNAQHIYDIFITQKHEGYSGHPEIELALMRLYHVTGDARWLELASHFINVRGIDPDFFEKEMNAREWTVWGSRSKPNHDYQQSAKPVREQKDAVGHSVRAVYLYTGMADLASTTNDESLAKACHALWESITQRRMYVTGGIGSTVIGEAFTVDYHLPNDTTYCETCASIGLIFFGAKMLSLEVDRKYSDVMERAFYNTVLAGMQLDGKRFFYVNPLAVYKGISQKAVTHQHVLTTRPNWYACACCPPNAARLISSIAKYAYGEDESTAYCHLFVDGEVEFKNGISLACITDYPYDLTVYYKVNKGGSVAIRVPNWSSKTTIRRNGIECDLTLVKGYFYINAQAGDVITLQFDENIKRIYTNTKVPDNTGFVALQRGPLVYCVEEHDNEDVRALSLAQNGEMRYFGSADDVLGKTIKLEVDGFLTDRTDSLYTFDKPKLTPVKITAIPYYMWGNRGETDMRVWLPEK